ncbi:MAG: molybdopterin-dependent oxidoreductase, partial [Chloroflexi bacterium]|nr:molybdopterin-dependent oxidoreductase [Chloroflexota bacterium]
GVTAAQAAAHAAPRTEGVIYDRVIPTLCEQCVWRCGVLAKVNGDKLVKLEGNPDQPHSRGKLCGRGQSGIMTAYDPDRIKFPMVRAGERGEGRYRRASWDEALDLTAQAMLDIKQKYGAEAMIFSATHNLSQPLFENLLYGFGSPNYGTQRSLCFNAMIVANQMTFGMEEPGRDYTNVKYIILTGRNLTEAISTSETGDLIESLARGAKVIYLDPRFTRTAGKATEWLPIKPGADLAFHLALINVIISENLYNSEFVAKNTVGFEELQQSSGSYTPEWAAPLTEIPADTIARIAREFAAAGVNALAHNGWRTSNFVNSFQTERAIAILNALVGNWGHTMIAAGGEGGGLKLGVPRQPGYPRIRAQRLDGVPWKYPLVPLKIGVFQEIRDNILTGQPYQAHGWFIARQNPIMSIPDRARTIEAFKKMDFIATVSILPNDTEWFADVILPEASYLERYDPLLSMGNRAYLRQPVIEPIGEAKSALWIYKQLGERLGLGAYFNYTDEIDYLNQQLAPLGVTVDDIRAQGYVEGPPAQSGAGEPELKFNTPSGKIEIASQTLRKANHPAVPAWEDPPAPPSGSFYLLTGKVGQHSQFATQNNQLLHKYQDEPRLWMNATVAEKAGLKDHDVVIVKSEVGQITIAVMATQAIRPDCVYLTPGFGHLSMGLRTAHGVGGSDSDLHVTYTDPISGGQALSQTFVTVAKA